MIVVSCFLVTNNIMTMIISGIEIPVINPMTIPAIPPGEIPTLGPAWGKISRSITALIVL